MNDAIAKWISTSLLDLGVSSDFLDGWVSSSAAFSNMPSDEGSLFPEDKYVGLAIPDHIYPLHFEHNLNTVVELVEKVERLASEVHKFALADMHKNFIDVRLRDSQEELSIHRGLSRQIEAEKIRLDLAGRLGNSLIDLLEYYKAAKIGFNLIYGHYFVDHADFGDSGNQNLSDLRRGIRGMLRYFRQFSSQEQQSTVSISLLRQKSMDGYMVTTPWAEGERNSTHKGLKDRVLRFNLNRASLHREILGSRILKVGVSIFDKSSGLKGFKGAESEDTQSIKYQDYWDVRIGDGDDGLPIYPGRRLVLGEILVPSAPGVRDFQSIRWIDNPRLINFPLARAWQIEISPSSLLGFNATDDYIVRDIILHFIIVHRIRGLS